MTPKLSKNQNSKLKELHKTVFEPYPDPKNSPFVPKYKRITPKSSQNQK